VETTLKGIILSFKKIGILLLFLALKRPRNGVEMLV